MAVYKVPQDVEADDKLIGPFSFRQFIYLLITAAAIALAWGLSRVFLPLAVIPLPVILLFGALALPLRKDQPMEVYLAAVLSYHMKPKKRLWLPDGITSLVEVTAPKTVEVQRTKGFDEEEAQKRLSYLAGIVDSQGWAVRGVADQSFNSALNSDVFFDAQRTEDVLDEGNTLAKNFDQMITKADTSRREQMLQKMKQTAAFAPPEPALQTVAPAPSVFGGPITDSDLGGADVHFNPYPNSMHQTVIQPLSEQQRAAEAAAQAQALQTQPAPAPVMQQSAPVQQPPQPQYQYPIPQPVQPVYAPQPAEIYQSQPEQVLPAVQEYVEPPAPEPTLLDESTDEPNVEQYLDMLAEEPPKLQDETPQTPSPETVSPDTIDLAINHHDLSVETIQREANRLKQKEKEQSLDEEEVVISLH